MQNRFFPLSRKLKDFNRPLYNNEKSDTLLTFLKNRGSFFIMAIDGDLRDLPQLIFG